MMYLFGRPLFKKDRLYLEYQRDWHEWAVAGWNNRFPPFVEWLAACKEIEKETAHVPS